MCKNRQDFDHLSCLFNLEECCRILIEVIYRQTCFPEDRDQFSAGKNKRELIGIPRICIINSLSTVVNFSTISKVYFATLLWKSLQLYHFYDAYSFKGP